MNDVIQEAFAPQWRAVAQYAGQRINGLQGMYLRGASAAKADLALLRKIDVGSDDRLLDAWEAVFQSPPDALVGRGDSPIDEERVLVTVLHMYAIHQQSKSEPMHVSGVGLGSAIRRLANPSDAESREKPVMRRYHALTTATLLSETVQHLRGLVTQFRAAGIPLDYARLASDLFLLQKGRSRASVRLAWARDLTRSSRVQTDQMPANATA